MKTVSDWIAAGHMDSGFYLIEKLPNKISEKAIGIELPKYNKAGDLVRSTAWFPKSKVKFVVNDHYTDAIDKEMKK